MDKKILVVEDMDKNIKEFERWLSRLELEGDDNLVIDFARTKAEALEKLHHRTYHVALLDIMLTDLSETDRSGIDVLSTIVDSQEGTLSIIMSGTKDHLVPRDAYRLGVIDYFDKSSDMRHPERWTQKVKDGLYKSKIALSGHSHAISDYLALPDRTFPFWTHNIASAIEINSSDVKNELEFAFGRLAPVLPRKSETKLISIQKEGLYGEYWSKGLGHAIAVCICKKGTEPINPGIEYQSNPIFDKKKRCRSVVWNISKSVVREDFDNSVFDRKYIPSSEEE